MKTNQLSFLLLIIFFTACKQAEDPIPPQDPVFQPYLDKFIAEAQKRGKSIPNLPLKIIFEGEPVTSSLSPAYADNTNHKIVIDSLTWKKSRLSYREFLMFHEFGHYFLDRPHRNDLMPNGEAYSLMEGRIDGRYSPHVVYRGMRIPYYLDELFNGSANTAIPSWAKADFEPVKPKKYGINGVFNFADPQQWRFLDPQICSIKNNRLEVDAPAGHKTFLDLDSLLMRMPNGKALKEKKQYEVEIDYSISAGTFDITWTGTEKSVGENQFWLTLFYTNYDGHDGILNSIYANGLYLKAENKANNKLILRRIGDFESFYLNGKLLFYADVLNPNTPNDSWDMLLAARSSIATKLSIQQITIREVVE